ncbi:hypothetical protein ASPWEDRAFT_176371 [Aspergillus wentii DTO 134E9]|uniref:Uncharacterized protein n=1 Tax=Aspergillus wentii DTO 134E9 TaxID=1073089 RepID=A0A1L9R8N7_ASPWE|nr:uncharacterized protein ASPWEDRAFT_176371 [Aspergillus wentii DTO 134E9]OJJ31284.1 hypothetical protein ASPWEDRAFT_176371 [Aspergillus wentii DTO 134E9]
MTDEITNLAHKVRAEWTTCQNYNDFAAMIGPDTVRTDEEAKTWLEMVQCWLHRLYYKEVSWFEFPISDDRLDDLVMVYGCCVELSPIFSSPQCPAYHRIMQTLFPVERRDVCLGLTPEEKPEEVIFAGAEAVGRNGWRGCNNVDDFGTLADLRKSTIQQLSLDYVDVDTNFISWITEAADEYLDQVQCYLKKGYWQGVGWIALPPQNDPEEDHLIYTYSELVKVSPFFKKSKLPDYHQILKRVSPGDGSWGCSTYRELYFFRQPREGQDMTLPIYNEILKRFHKYHPRGDGLRHAPGPYMAIVGGRRSGKSFYVQQLARQGYAYVVYSCVAHRNSKAFPTRSKMANDLGKHQHERHWECYIVAGLANVQICRRLGISPRVFFDLQVKEEFHDFQRKLSQQISDFYFAVRSMERYECPKPKMGSGKQEYEYFYEALETCIQSYKVEMERMFVQIHAKLKIYQEYHNSLDPTAPEIALKEGHPAALFCIDEACDLAVDIADWREKFQRIVGALFSRSQDRWDANDRFFTLFLDREMRQMYSGYRMLEPLNIDTMEVDVKDIK